MTAQISPSVVAGSVVRPGGAGVGREAGGGDLVIAERGGDDRGGHVEHVLTDCGGAAAGGRDAEPVDQRRQSARLKRLAGAEEQQQGTGRQGMVSSGVGVRVKVLSHVRMHGVCRLSGSGALSVVTACARVHVG